MWVREEEIENDVAGIRLMGLNGRSGSFCELFRRVLRILQPLSLRILQHPTKNLGLVHSYGCAQGVRKKIVLMQEQVANGRDRALKYFNVPDRSGSKRKTVLIVKLCMFHSVGLAM
jgi:hypothetical protein